MLAVLGEAIVGLILLTGATVCAVVIIARSIAKNTEHNQATCNCVDCRGRRNRAHQKRYGKDRTGRTQSPRPRTKLDDPDWLDTTELRKGMLLESKQGIPYRVYSVNRHDDRYAVRLENTKTNVVGLPIIIMNAQIYNKIWKRL